MGYSLTRKIEFGGETAQLTSDNHWPFGEIPMDSGADKVRPHFKSATSAAKDLASRILLEQKDTRHLILAGDHFQSETDAGDAIDTSEAINVLLEIVSRKYEIVIYTPGNHDLRRLNEQDRLNPWRDFMQANNLYIPQGPNPITVDVGRAKVLAGNLFYHNFLDPRLLGFTSDDVKAFYSTLTDGRSLLDGIVSLDTAFPAMVQNLAAAIKPDIDMVVTHSLPDPRLVSFRFHARTDSAERVAAMGIPVIIDPEEDELLSAKYGKSAEQYRFYWNMKSFLMGSGLFDPTLGAQPKDGLVLAYGHNHRGAELSLPVNGRNLDTITHQRPLWTHPVFRAAEAREDQDKQSEAPNANFDEEGIFHFSSLGKGKEWYVKILEGRSVEAFRALELAGGQTQVLGQEALEAFDGKRADQILQALGYKSDGQNFEIFIFSADRLEAGVRIVPRNEIATPQIAYKTGTHARNVPVYTMRNQSAYLLHNLQRIPIPIQPRTLRYKNIFYYTRNSNKIPEIQGAIPEAQPMEYSPIMLPVPTESVQSAALENLNQLVDSEKLPGKGEAILLDVSNLFLGKDYTGAMEMAVPKGVGLEGYKTFASTHIGATAYTKTVLLVRDGSGHTHLFEGVQPGIIVYPYPGRDFSWDGIFQPDGADVPLNQMSTEIKALFSARGKALEKLAKFLYR